MAKIKIILDKAETIENTEESLFKALNMHRTGAAHTEDFTDPAMVDLHDKLINKHAEMIKLMLEEIFQALDSEL